MHCIYCCLCISVRRLVWILGKVLDSCYRARLVFHGGVCVLWSIFSQVLELPLVFDLVERSSKLTKNAEQPI